MITYGKTRRPTRDIESADTKHAAAAQGRMTAQKKQFDMDMLRVAGQAGMLPAGGMRRRSARARGGG